MPTWKLRQLNDDKSPNFFNLLINLIFLKMTYEEYRAKLRSLTNEELIGKINQEVGKPGWVAARGRYLSALRETVLERGIDGGEAVKTTGLSLKYKVKLVGNRIVQLKESGEFEQI